MVAALLLICNTVAPPVFGAKITAIADKAENANINISADKLTSRHNSNTAVFSGNVKATYKGVRIDSDTLTIHYKNRPSSSDRKPSQPLIEKIIADGHVTIRMDGRTAVCDNAAYTPDSGLIVLTGGNAEIKSDKNHINGKKITINRNTGEITVVGSAQKRVEAVFQSSDENGTNGGTQKSEKKKTGE